MGNNHKEKKEKKVLKISHEFVKVKISGPTVLYFGVNLREKTIQVLQPDGIIRDSYFKPLFDEITPENHEKFIRTYKIGIDYCKKLLGSKK